MTERPMGPDGKEPLPNVEEVAAMAPDLAAWADVRQLAEELMDCDDDVTAVGLHAAALREAAEHEIVMHVLGCGGLGLSLDVARAEVSRMSAIRDEEQRVAREEDQRIVSEQVLRVVTSNPGVTVDGVKFRMTIHDDEATRAALDALVREKRVDSVRVEDELYYWPITASSKG